MRRESLEEIRAELERARAELAEARATIAWMEASRFWRVRNAWWRFRQRVIRLRPGRRPDGWGPTGSQHAVASPPPGRAVAPRRTSATVDVIVCVHDALDDVRDCLDSIVRRTRPPYRLIVVDDGSGDPTREYLRGFASAQGALLFRNEVALGYTRAANVGLRASNGAFAVLLNSDTVVTASWLDRLVACAESGARIAAVGPLSNCASWQSLPEVLEENGDWSENPLPRDVTLDRMAAIVGEGAPTYPRLPFLNGFCLMIKREALREVGLFDEEAFGRGYGEENDFALRCQEGGWQLAVADDTYVFHRQSRSYSHDRRLALSAEAGVALGRKHDQALVEAGVLRCRESRVLEGKRLRSREAISRLRLRDQARARHEGRRVLFVLPVVDRGGGANVVFSEARSLRRMGVDARVLNLEAFREGFRRSYPDLDVPVQFAPPGDIPDVARRFDAVVATAFSSVAWLVPLARSGRAPVLGYYVQDFEPSFFAEGSRDHRRAWDSYALVPGIRRFAKTAWNASEVESRVGVTCTVVGASFDVDLFRPFEEEPPSEPLRVTAMVRPSTPRRQPGLTLDVLEEASRRFGGRVDLTIFGVAADDPDYLRLRRAFPHRHAGVLDERGLVALLNRTHVFLDASRYQAMGLTALEAMGCGATAILPSAGGAGSFAVNGENALLVDTASADGPLEALSALAADPGLRARLARQARRSVVPLHADLVASRILSVLFEDA